jgi:hypothetical protein
MARDGIVQSAVAAAVTAPPQILRGAAALERSPAVVAAVAPALADGFASDPTAVSWANGRIDIFARGADNALWHKWYQNSWSGWESLGGTIASGPDVCSWGAGRLDVFARGTDNTLVHKWYDNGWSGWESLGGGITSDPSAVSWGAGRIDVFARGTDNTLYHRYFQGGWSGWESLGGVLSSGPDVSSWGAGRLDVFVRGTDNALAHKYFENGWSGWESLGGGLTSDPSAVSWGPGRIDVFARGTNNALYHRYFQSGWSGWESLGGVLTSAPDASSWGNQRLDIFAIGTDRNLAHLWYSNGWGQWESLGAPAVVGVLQASTDPARAHFRVTVNGFTAHHETWDNVLQVDGKRDEVYITSDVQVVDKQSNKVASSVRSKTFGDVNGFPYRVQAGSASSQGGIQTGDNVFGGTPWARSGALQPDQLPMLIWEGDLIDGQNAVAIIVAPWEYDGGQDVYHDWVSWMQGTSQKLQSSTAFTQLIGEKGKTILDLTELGLGVALSLQESVLGTAQDRPIGFVQTGTTSNGTAQYGFTPKVLALNYTTAQLQLAQNFGMGNGIIGIRFTDAAKFAGDYTLYVQVERVP